jgi:hypothetical protein
MSSVHIFCRVICFAELFQSIVFWVFFSCVDFFVLYFQPGFVGYKSFNNFVTKFLIFWIEFNDFLMLKIQVEGILFVFCHLISINNNFDIHSVLLFRKFFVYLQIPYAQMPVSFHPFFEVVFV